MSARLRKIHKADGAFFEVVTVYSSVIEQPDPRHLNQMLNTETSATDKC